MPNNDRSPKLAAGTSARLTPAELAYLLGESRLGRLATADATAAPHVVPVGWSYNRDLGTIDISGRNFAATRKYRNVQANPRAAFVVDDVLPPFRPRAVMVQGTAHALDANHSGSTEAMIRIVPRQDHLLGPGRQSVNATVLGRQPAVTTHPREKGLAHRLQMLTPLSGCSTDASPPGNTSTSCPSSRRTRYGGAPSRPRISMISDVWSGVPTTRPCTCNRSPTTARMATPLKGPLQTASTFRAVSGRGTSAPELRA
jgi:PPOX class F420-dependent enzyme/OxyR family protein